MELWRVCLGSFLAAAVLGCGGRAEGGEDDDALGPPPPPAAPPPAYRGNTAPPATSTPAPPDQAPVGQASSLDEWELQREVVEELLGKYCGNCHGAAAIANGNVMGDFDYVEDIEEMVLTGLIIPLNPAQSPLVQSIVSGEMPPRGVQPRPSQSEIRALEDYIAPTRFW